MTNHDGDDELAEPEGLVYDDWGSVVGFNGPERLCSCDTVGCTGCKPAEPLPHEVGYVQRPTPPVHRCVPHCGCWWWGRKNEPEPFPPLSLEEVAVAQWTLFPPPGQQPHSDAWVAKRLGIRESGVQMLRHRVLKKFRAHTAKHFPALSRTERSRLTEYHDTQPDEPSKPKQE